MKVICGPASTLPDRARANVRLFSLFSNPGLAHVGWAARGWPDSIRKAGIVVPQNVWDFSTLCLAAACADFGVSRIGSPDGWTREIELDVAVSDPGHWNALSDQIAACFSFLTGDIWSVSFRAGGEPAPVAKKPVLVERSCVSLLSGGLDSLVGGIDEVAAGRAPLFVSHLARGDGANQKRFAWRLAPGIAHFQWNSNINPARAKETSQRGRSLIFLGYAVLAAAALRSFHHEGTADVVVPENGFISLNVPLTPSRHGSLSTRTTHPLFLDAVQRILDSAGIGVALRFPYRHATKGEMLKACADRQLLRSMATQSVSCGKYLRNKYVQCGRCIPCLVRRASFLHAGIKDETKYGNANLRDAGRDKGPNDIGALSHAIVRLRQQGVKKLIGASLAFATQDERDRLADVVERGFNELEALLHLHKVL